MLTLMSLSKMMLVMVSVAAISKTFFFFNDPPTPEIYTLSLHDALPISAGGRGAGHFQGHPGRPGYGRPQRAATEYGRPGPACTVPLLWPFSGLRRGQRQTETGPGLRIHRNPAESFEPGGAGPNGTGPGGGQ